MQKSQIGFLPNYRASDHIFTLHTLIDQQLNQHKSKIFSCFVDFGKAFDSIWHEGLLLKILESGVGGKTYDVIKTMYKNNECAVKIGAKRTDFFPQKRGVMQGNNLSPTLFNIYINELAKTLEESTAPGIKLNDTEIICLLYADDLVLLSSSKEGLQQLLDHLHQFCQTWALTVNRHKTKTMIFQKRSRCQGNKLTFLLGSTKINQTNEYTYLGIKISSTGNFNLAVNELKEKAQIAFYAIKRSTNLNNVNIPIKIWMKIFKSVIEPIALYGCEVWGTLTHQDLLKWDKHPIEIMHTQFCKSILKVQRKTPNNACRAELGQFPLLINIQKRIIKFYQHLKNSDPHTYHHKAFQCHGENSPLNQLVLRLCSENNTSVSQDRPQTIWPNQIITKQKENYISHWKDITKTQSKLECYLALNREYTLADYLTMINDQKLRKSLTMYRLSDHSLAIEKGRHRHSWLPREERFCQQCSKNEIETEVHFLLHCDKYTDIREKFMPKFRQKCPEFDSLSEQKRAQYLLGEKDDCAIIAARYITSCHSLRDSQ